MGDLCVVVNSKLTSDIRKVLLDLGLQDQERRLKHLREENCVAIPVKESTLTGGQLVDSLRDKLEDASGGTDIEIMRIRLPKAKSMCVLKPEAVMQQALKRMLESKGHSWSPELAAEVPGHWEIHGDLALIPCTAFTSPLWASLGDELWRVVADSLSCRRLAGKSVVQTDGFRSPQVTLLLGDSGWVQQVDNSIRYTYDVTRCMFSSGNITEKLRIASFDCTNQVVVDLYAGIGYFTLPYLVYTGVKHLHACEWNPDAVEALRRNLELNHVAHRCTIHAGDNRQTCPKGIADRVNLGLIPSSREGWLPACAALRPDTGGILHIHCNVNTKPAGNRSDVQNSSEPGEQFRKEAKCHHSQSEKGDGYHSQSEKGDGYHNDKQASDHLDNTGRSNSTETLHLFDGTQSPDVSVNEKYEIYGLDTDTPKFASTNNLTSVCDQENNIVIICDQKCKKFNSVEKDDMEDLWNCNDKEIVAHDIAKCNRVASAYEFHRRLQPYCIEPTEYFACRKSSNRGIRDAAEKPGIECNRLSDNYNVRVKSKWMPWAETVSVEIKTLLEKIHGGLWNTDILHIEHVKSYAPYVDHVVLDLRCRPRAAVKKESTKWFS